MTNVENVYEYDLVVIGGGSGGMAAAKKVSIFVFNPVVCCRKYLRRWG